MKLTLSKSIIQLKHQDRAVSRQESLSKVTALSYSADGTRLAVATADRAISLYDRQGRLVDRFQTKPNGDGPKDYTIRSIQFGPNTDHPKLAIAQSDAIVFVYKWKQTSIQDGKAVWDGKKSICNKFPEQSAVASLIWAKKQPFQVVYGLFEGKVKIGNLRSNKSKTLYKIDCSPVVSLAMDIDQTELLSGHVDGCIYRFIFPTKEKNSSCTKLFTSTTIPYVLSWGKSICVAGLDDKVTFYDMEGNEVQNFTYNYSQQDNSSAQLYDGKSSSEFTLSCCNPGGDCIVIGSFDCFYEFCWDTKLSSWHETAKQCIKNMYSVTAIDWNPSGSSFALGTSSGLVDEYDAVYRQYVYKDAFHIKYISPYQVLIRDNEDMNESPIVILSSRGEITKLNIFYEPGTSTYRYLVARTSRSFILCDIESPTQPTSEIYWHFDDTKKERFIFDASNACMICKEGEITIVEYGQNEVLASIQTRFHSPCLLSLRVKESVYSSQREMMSSVRSKTKIVAYLLDQRTICIKDLVKMDISSIEHDSIVDFVELNTTCSHLIFRDMKQNLMLYNVKARVKRRVMSNCGYVQWIPCTDVLVAQSGSRMKVWYNIQSPNQVSSTEIGGEIEGIERTDGRTEVLVDVDGTMIAYSLSNDLICFKTALQDRDLTKCVDILERTIGTEENREMWQELQRISLQLGSIPVTKRCAAALGNISLVRFIHSVQKCTGHDESGLQRNWKAQGKITQLRKAFLEAEKLYLSYNKVNDVIFMYENLMMFQDALRVVKNHKSSDFEVKRKFYFNSLMETGYEEKAAEVMEMVGDPIHAISIYLEIRLPGKAAQVVLDKDIIHPPQLLERVAASLANLGSMKKAAQVYERIGQIQNALSHFIKGFAFQEALTLARNEIPSKVTEVEEFWGDHLVLMNQHYLAVDHFLNSHSLQKAIEASIEAKMWDAALEIVEQLEGLSKPNCESLARKFINVKRFQEAEKLYMMANMRNAIVSMYLSHEMWDEAITTARNLLDETEIHEIFIKEVETMIKGNHYYAAEQLLLLLDSPKKAIEMWKSIDNFDKAMDLVNEYCPQLSVQTHQYFAGTREKENRLDEAEIFYINAGDWLGAINMYRKSDKWDDAIRIAQASDDDEILKRVAYAYSIFLGDNAQKILSDLYLLDSAVQFAIDIGSFDNAIKLAEGMKSQDDLVSLYTQSAEALEKSGNLLEAANEYMKARNVSGAMKMYISAKSFDDAEKIARKFNSQDLPLVLLAKANDAAANGFFEDAEQLFIESGKPELILDLYKKNEMWDDAHRISRKYFPNQYKGNRKASDESDSEGLSNSIEHNETLEEGDQFDADKDIVKRMEEILRNSTPNTLESFLSTILDEKNTIPDYNLHINLYLILVQKILKLNEKDERSIDYCKMLADLRAVLSASLMKFQTASNDVTTTKTLIHLIMTVHYNYLMEVCNRHGLLTIACKCSLTILRFAIVEVDGSSAKSLIPADKVFYKAGVLCRKMDHHPLAFMILNKYIDIIEAMEEDEFPGFTDNDFDGTNVAFDNISIPTEHYIHDEDSREEIRDWVLGICINSSFERDLPKVGKSIKCELHEGLYDCSQHEKCIITGFPIPENSLMKLQNVDANEADWNSFVNKVGHQPWDDINVASANLNL